MKHVIIAQLDRCNIFLYISWCKHSSRHTWTRLIFMPWEHFLLMALWMELFSSFFTYTSKKTKCPYYWPNPPATSGSPNKGSLMLKVYYFDRNLSENHSWGTRHFFDGLFYHYIHIIMSTVASHITSFVIVYSTVYSRAGEKEHSSSASPAF